MEVYWDDKEEDEGGWQEFSLDFFKGGWFVGDFEPSIWRDEGTEVAVKRYKAGDKEKAHVHKVAHELTVVVSGIIRMNGREYGQDKILHLFPGQPSDFEALTDAVTVCVKSPSVKGDKYEIDSTSR